MKTLKSRSRDKIIIIDRLEMRILEIEKQLEYERGLLEANKKRK